MARATLRIAHVARPHVRRRARCIAQRVAKCAAKCARGDARSLRDVACTRRADALRDVCASSSHQPLPQADNSWR
ncbi:MAG: hypothetical protein ABI629_14780, partial [bacterium]